MWPYPHFMKKPKSSSLSARLSSKKSKSYGLQDERVSSYVEDFNILLATYATNDAIARVVKRSETYKQLPGTAPTDVAKKLYTKALRSGMVYEEKSVTCLFVKRLKNALCENVQSYWSRNSSKPPTRLARYDDTLTKITDTRSTALTSTNRPNRAPSSIRKQNRWRNQSFSV